MPPSEVVSLCLFTKDTWLGTGRWTCHWKLPQQVALTVLKAQVKAIVRVLIATLSVDRTTYWRVVHKSLSWRTSLDLFIWPDLALHNHSQLPMTGYQRRRPQSSSWWEETNLDSPPDKCFLLKSNWTTQKVVLLWTLQANDVVFLSTLVKCTHRVFTLGKF